MVLHLRQHDLVAGPEFVQAPRERHEVLGFGGVLREHHLLPVLAADELGELVVGVLVRDGGLLTEFVEPAVDVRVVPAVVVGDDVDDLVGRLRGGCVVQVDEVPAVRDLPLQNGEVRPYSVDVERRLLGCFHWRELGGVATIVLRCGQNCREQ